MQAPFPIFDKGNIINSILVEDAFSMHLARLALYDWSSVVQKEKKLTMHTLL